jgi:hypothetical protein
MFLQTPGYIIRPTVVGFRSSWAQYGAILNGKGANIVELVGGLGSTPIDLIEYFWRKSRNTVKNTVRIFAKKIVETA